MVLPPEVFERLLIASQHGTHRKEALRDWMQGLPCELVNAVLLDGEDGQYLVQLLQDAEFVQEGKAYFLLMTPGAIRVGASEHSRSRNLDLVKGEFKTWSAVVDELYSTCPICLESMRGCEGSTTNRAVMLCGRSHYAHTSCYRTLSEKTSHCPCCRGPLMQTEVTATELEPRERYANLKRSHGSSVQERGSGLAPPPPPPVAPITLSVPVPMPMPPPDLDSISITECSIPRDKCYNVWGFIADASDSMTYYGGLPWKTVLHFVERVVEMETPYPTAGYFSVFATTSKDLITPGHYGKVMDPLTGNDLKDSQGNTVRVIDPCLENGESYDQQDEHKRFYVLMPNGTKLYASEEGCVYLDEADITRNPRRFGSGEPVKAGSDVYASMRALVRERFGEIPRRHNVGYGTAAWIALANGYCTLSRLTSGPRGTFIKVREEGTGMLVEWPVDYRPIIFTDGDFNREADDMVAQNCFVRRLDDQTFVVTHAILVLAINSGRTGEGSFHGIPEAGRVVVKDISELDTKFSDMVNLMRRIEEEYNAEYRITNPNTAPVKVRLGKDGYSDVTIIVPGGQTAITKYPAGATRTCEAFVCNLEKVADETSQLMHQSRGSHASYRRRSR